MSMTKRDGRFIGFSYSATIGAAETEILPIPPLDSGAQISVTAIPGANTALVQHTTSSDVSVAAETATWVDWPSGSVTVTTSDVVDSPITGLKFTATGGDCTFEVVI